MLLSRTGVETASPGPRATQRIRSLDGIRGLAAFVVVIHHVLLVVPALAAPYYEGRRVVDPSVLAWVMVHTPLHLVWAGTEAVYVFFVLSGCALTLAVSRRRDWRTYYPQRLVRLYLPVFGAVALAAALAAVVPHVAEDGMSRWLLYRPDLGVAAVLRDATLVRGVSGFVTPLWSLRWEVLFSLALPAYVWAARRWPAAIGWKLALTFGVIFVGALRGSDALLYLPMFNVGVLLATRLDSVRAAARRIDEQATARAIWATLFATALLLLPVTWYVAAFDPPGAVIAAAQCIAVGAAALLLFVGIGWGRLRVALESRTIQWLGAISFSLYLVHEPVIVTIAFLAGSSAAVAWLPVAVIAAFAVAVLFSRLVEQPSLRLSRAVGARAARSAPVEPDVLATP